MPLANINRILLDGVAAMISPSRDLLEEERREHLHLFNLIGDPMLRLTYPAGGHAERAARRRAGREAADQRAARALAGQGVLELVCRRDCFKAQPPMRERFDPTDKGLAALQGVYQQALDRCWARWALELPAGEFATDITIPAGCRGPCHVRLLVANHQGHALGSTNLYIQPPRPAEVARPAPVAGAR